MRTNSESIRRLREVQFSNLKTAKMLIDGMKEVFMSNPLEIDILDPVGNLIDNYRDMNASDLRKKLKKNGCF